jgi:hypothetical protein
VREAFEIAEQNRQAIFAREPRKLFVNDRSEFVLAIVVGAVPYPLGGTLFVSAPARRDPSGSVGNPNRNAMKPRGDRPSISDTTSVSDEDEEGCLKRVLSVVIVTEDPPANPVDHRPVPLHERSKREIRGGP